MLNAARQFEHDADELIQQFKKRSIGFSECVAGLETALDRCVVKIAPGEVASVQRLVYSKNRTILKEMAKRSSRAFAQDL